MKTSNKFIGHIALLIFSMATPSVTAQFRDANLLQNTVPLSPISANNTGNDIKDYLGSTYEVSVWDDANGANAGMYWKKGINTGFLNLNPAAGVKDPDVALVTNNAGSVYALVAYYAQTTSEFTFEPFEWNAGAQAFTSLGAMPIQPGIFEKTINIDANSIGDFMIVWDEPGMMINSVTGSTPQGGMPSLNIGGAVLPLEPGHSPDVSILNLTSGENQADVVYINPQNRISVDFYRMDDIMNGVVALTNGFRSPAPDLAYRYPRIATPNSGAGDPADFTVVAEDNDLNSTWYIKGFNSNACCNPIQSFTIYNDGSTSNSPYNLTDYPNTRPVVSYDRTYTNIWVGWNFDNTAGMLPAPGSVRANSPIILIGNKHALPLPAQNYLYVPNQLVTNDVVGKLSLSGRNAVTNLLTYSRANNSTVYTKSVNQFPAPSSLRTTVSHQHPVTFLSESAIDNERLNVTCFDVAGRMVYEMTGSASEILNEMNVLLQDHDRMTLMLVKIDSLTGENLYTGKALLANP